MTLGELVAIAKQYNVKNINLGGCVEGQAQGFQGAMRRSAHAHFLRWRGKEQTWGGWICVKSSKVEKLLKSDGEPNQLFWHEVSHIYRPSRTQKECDQWAWKMVRQGL